MTGGPAAAGAPMTTGGSAADGSAADGSAVPGSAAAGSVATDGTVGLGGPGAAGVDDGDPLGAYPYLLRSAPATRVEPVPAPSAVDLPFDFAASVPEPGAGAGAGAGPGRVPEPGSARASESAPARGTVPEPASGSACTARGSAPYDYAHADAPGAQKRTRLVPMSWERARALAARAVSSPLPPVHLSLAHALGGILAAPLEALTDLPAFDTSAMDGWAVSGPGPWRIGDGPTAERILAGRCDATPLADGSAVRIATGAQLPPGATAVLRSEDGQVGAGQPGCELLHDRGATPLEQGRDIRPRGQECRTGEPLLPSGAAVTPAVLGLAAAAGCDRLLVHRRPTVDLLVLGDELLDSGPPANGRTRDALGPLLPSWLRAYGARVGTVRRVGDDLALLNEALLGSTADVIVTTGGTAAGPVDFLHPALSAIGATLLVDGVLVRPGHPMLLALLPAGPGQRARFVVGLPGNPLAAVAGAVTLAEPLLRALGGGARTVPYLVEAAVPLPGHHEDTRMVPVALPERGVLPLAFDGPAMLRGLALAEGLAVVPPGGVPAGARVEVLEVPAG